MHRLGRAYAAPADDIIEPDAIRSAAQRVLPVLVEFWIGE